MTTPSFEQDTLIGIIHAQQVEQMRHENETRSNQKQIDALLQHVYEAIYEACPNITPFNTIWQFPRIETADVPAHDQLVLDGLVIDEDAEECCPVTVVLPMSAIDMDKDELVTFLSDKIRNEVEPNVVDQVLMNIINGG